MFPKLLNIAHITAQSPRAGLDNGEWMAEPFQPPVLRSRDILYRTQIFSIPDHGTNNKKRGEENS
jgi:hypothetical protein